MLAYAWGIGENHCNMANFIVEQPTRLEFDAVHVGDSLVISTGVDDAAWHYDMTVTEMRHWPTTDLIAYTPGGEATEAVPFELHGCGRWTTQRQNPVQRQTGLAFTPYYNGVIVGDFMFGRLAGQTDRVRFDHAGQEISAINHTPYRENTVLDILREQGAPVGIKDILKEVVAFPFGIAERDVRTTLRGLIESGHVSLLKKRVQLFELSSQPDD
jgi:hypothetical protein